MIKIINPWNSLELTQNGDFLVDSTHVKFPIIDGVPRICNIINYTENFGLQWNKFDRTQLDNEAIKLDLSAKRFFKETTWNPSDLAGENILEVGSGAGRFTKVILEFTEAALYSIDYSNAVSANYKNNSPLAPARLNLFQADIYHMPFSDGAFDRVFCFGVLQHTPNFELAVQELIRKTKPGGEIVVDFYPVNGWWTWIHGKYLYRPLVRKMSLERMARLIDYNIGWLMTLSLVMKKFGLGLLTRFLPLVDLNTLPVNTLTAQELKEWARLDTFDMFSPVYDNPKKVAEVVTMFEKSGATVTYAGFVSFGDGLRAAVVRGVAGPIAPSRSLQTG